MKKKPDMLINLWEYRRVAVAKYIQDYNITSVADFGCGDGKLISYLIEYFKSHKALNLKFILGMDMDLKECQSCSEIIKKIAQLKQKEYDKLMNSIPFKLIKKKWKYPSFNINLPSISIYQNNILHSDENVKKEMEKNNVDLIASIEVVEHVYPEQVDKYFYSLLKFYATKYVLITTPNVEYNVKYKMKKNGLRHPDHKFEWTREDFQSKCKQKAEFFGYDVLFDGVGEFDENLGHPSQLAFFIKKENFNNQSNTLNDTIEIGEKEDQIKTNFSSLVYNLPFNEFIMKRDEKKIKLKKLMVDLYQISKNENEDTNGYEEFYSYDNYRTINIEKAYSMYRIKSSFKNLEAFQNFLIKIKKVLRRYKLKIDLSHSLSTPTSTKTDDIIS